MKNFTLEGRAKFFLGIPRGANWSDLKKSKNLYTKRWSQPTAKISAFQLNQKVFKNWGLLGGFWPPRVGGGPDFKNLKKPYTERWCEPTPKISALQLSLVVKKLENLLMYARSIPIHLYTVEFSAQSISIEVVLALTYQKNSRNMNI